MTMDVRSCYVRKTEFLSLEREIRLQETETRLLYTNGGRRCDKLQDVVCKFIHFPFFLLVDAGWQFSCCGTLDSGGNSNS